ncbi:uncharacterized protein TNCV_3273961 [Trichonephila clavipes]|nr:uncharacterized protein TNCV_3273961 [Trichonephila clavipes]
MIFPNLRTKTTGEFLKLYTNNHEEYHSLKETIKQLHYQFYVITAKNDRPIKVVIKGLPKSTHVDEIKSDLEEQGFEQAVVQLIGKKTKKPLPVYMILLPRNITNLKIFDIKTLGYLSIRVEPYEGRAVLRPILSYGCPVWGYAAMTNINILDVAQNTSIRMIVGACRCMKNDEIRNAIKFPSFKSHIQKLAKNFFNSLNRSKNVNMQNLENYTARIKRKRPRSILLDSYNPP